jgi:hypothetical protein
MGWREKLGFRRSPPAPPRAPGDRAREAPAPPRAPGDRAPEATRWRNVKVVGESHYQGALWAATGLANTGQRVDFECIAELVPEPDNPHDPRAIMVQVQGRCVGYLSRGSARLYGKRIREMRAAGQPTICDAFIGGLAAGDENPNLGITLKFPVHEDGSYRIELGAADLARRILGERRRA